MDSNKKPSPSPRKMILVVIIVLAGLVLISMMFGSSGSGSNRATPNQFVEFAKTEKVEGAYRVQSGENSFTVVFQVGGKSMEVPNLTDSDFAPGSEFGYAFRVKESKPREKRGSSFISMLSNFAPMILFIVFMLWMMSRLSNGQANGVMRIVQSKARAHSSNTVSVTFDDVAGIEEVKAELQELVEFLKFPERFTALGAKMPKGALLMGPPGVGKTLLAKAVAGEAKVPFFEMAGSGFVEMFVGVGASRVRNLFDQARRNAPCILFIDEIDAVGRHRGAGLGGGNDEREQTLNQILAEMDGFNTATNVIVIAATNRPDILDPALMRPGRFDRKIVVPAPDKKGRKEILTVHMRGKPMSKDGLNPATAQEVEAIAENMARQSLGSTGADLAGAVNEGAILAAREHKKFVTEAHISEGFDRTMAGPQRKGTVLSPKEKELVAYHEGGHAIMGHVLPNIYSPSKISIIARGLMGGYTKSAPEGEEKTFHTKNELCEMIAAALGGYVAEEMLLHGDTTQGPGHDLEQVTAIARRMVTQYGMTNILLPQSYGSRQGPIFLAREMHDISDSSEKRMQMIEEAVDEIVRKALYLTRKVLTG
jgi:cell division protease FtsH